MAPSVGPQAFIHPEPPTPDAIAPIKNGIGLAKPDGGLWTSTWDAATETSPWLKWCTLQGWYPHEEADVWLLEPDPAADLYHIDSLTALKALHSEFPLSGPVPSLQLLDWEAIAETYDGLHLTEQGQTETRFSQPTLYGWDCESTLWFDWQFTGEPEQVATDVYQ